MALRSLFRRAAKPLPAGAQVAIRRAKDALAGETDAAARVAAVRARDEAWMRETASREAAKLDRHRILIAAPQLTRPWLDTSYGLATALWLRGQEITGVLCDGLVPICEMNLGGQDRPACAMCLRWLSRHEEAYGFRFTRLTDYITPADYGTTDALVRAEREARIELTTEGVDVGRFAHRELLRHRRGFVFDPNSDPAFQQWLVSGVLFTRLFVRLIEHQTPDIVITPSGRTLIGACVSAVARAHDVRVVSWDTEPSFPDALVFSHDRPAVEIPLDDAWSLVQDEPLGVPEVQRLRSFLSRWSRSDGTPFPYNPAPIEDASAIRSELGLRKGHPLIVAFANSAWDMAVVDRDVAFASMFDWLFALVDYAIAHPDVDLVVRAHPAEVKVPADLVSRTPVVQEIKRRYPRVPDNVKLLSGHSAVSSYVLADLATVPMVYSSRLGLEIAIRGRRPWIAGEVTYRGKGFSCDVASKADMIARLDARSFDEELTPAERERAERFAYLWFFRYVTRLPILRSPDGSLALDSFRPFAPDGGDPTLDRICRAILDGTPFVDLAS